MQRPAVVGASPAGLSAARAARAQGFSGRLAIIGGWHHRPYDRPPQDAVAVLGMNQPRLFTKWRRGLVPSAPKPSPAAETAAATVR